MKPLMSERFEDYYYALSLVSNEDMFISDDDLLLIAEDYIDSDIGKILLKE